MERPENQRFQGVSLFFLAAFLGFMMPLHTFVANPRLVQWAPTALNS
jgi:hypothetical protein